MKTSNLPSDCRKFNPSNGSAIPLKNLILTRPFYFGLILLLSSSLFLNSCKKDSDDPLNKTSNCKVVMFDFGGYSITYTYDNNRLMQLELGNFTRTFNYDVNGKLSHIYWASPTFKDTTDLIYDAQGRRIASLKYYKGQLDDSISYHYNSDGTLAAIYDHYIDEPNFVHYMAIFFTYSNGKLQKIETYFDENEDGVLDLTKMDSKDEYDLIVVTLNDIINPLYGAWIYENDLSGIDPMWFTTHMISREEVSGNTWEGYQSDYTYQTNEHGYPTVMQYKDSDGKSGSFSLMYSCD